MRFRTVRSLTGAAGSLAAAVALSGAAAAGEIDISINDDVARGMVSWPAFDGRFQADAGWLHNQDEGDVGHVGLHVAGLATGGQSPIRAGLGGRLVYFDADRRDRDGTALPLGGFFRYTFPTLNRLNIGGYGYFAPDVLTFGDGEEFMELGLDVGYQVLREADVYLGVRYISAEFDDTPEVDLDEGLHLGIRLRF